MSSFGDAFKNMREELDRKLGDIAKGPVPLAELFPPTFMTARTSHASLEEFLESTGMTAEQFAAAEPTSDVDRLVRDHSSFTSRDDMLQTAWSETVDRRAKQAGWGE